ncbi:YdhK family protein [Macrococcoides bohemicum]|uniref:YdhK family protein n=1 Tax=Macrococcoides bohemicum TaxID=1903056 RepID=A0AAJ4TXC5_9STAP|nr:MULTISPECIES: YdhK family protein [Macrococcus]MBC9873961.1 YdhK family protein [Macrococcus bohemicus]MCH4985770.1 YdhK family protein [Macrococcus sp. PK]QYA42447.1 YdhK family protein [Macrococcus bohemicus]
MVKNKILLGLLSIFAVFLMAACGNGETQPNEESQSTETESRSEEEMDMESHSEGHMEHSADEMSSSGEVPEDLKEAENPTYEVGSRTIIEAEHMQGMDGAEATISGAFDTTVYTVSYTPTNGGDPVEDHKWVIHEELEGPGEAPLEPGTEVTLDADHMKGMDGATATIDSAEETTVYMVDFVTTDTEEEVQNHKWVTESELAPVE